jgi:DNA-binding response OmpR family regulator
VADLLIIDPSQDARLPEAFSRAGFQVRVGTAPAAAFEGTPPDAVLLQAELASTVTRELIAGLRRNPAFASVPVVLLSRDASDALACARFRTGVVDILPVPFDEAAHPDKLKKSLEGLAARKGVVEAGDGLSRFLQHVRRALRSGELTVAAGTPDEGRASFVEGALRTAQRGKESGDVALLSMLSGRTRWRFVETAPSTPAPAGPKTPEVSLPSLPLLLVDDDPDLRALFSTYLKRQGFAVDTAADGNEGYEAAIAKPYEVIVADLNMPNLDGWGMLRKLRADHRTREIPVAVLSAHDDYREALKAKSAGARIYLAKGTRLEPVAKEIAGLLEPRRTFLANAIAGNSASVSLWEAGPAWTLRALAKAKVTGALEVEEGWARYSLYLRSGILSHVHATSAQHEAEGPRALNAFLVCELGEAVFVPNAPAPPANLSGSIDRLIGDGQEMLNENDRQTQEALLVSGRTVGIDPELYGLYAQLGPKDALETARLFCEERLSAREVIAHSPQSPVEVEQVLIDLVRRGVVKLGS